MLGEEADFVHASGPDYFRLLKAMHKQLKPSLYLEVGSRTGNSLALTDCDFIAIDPVFNLKRLTVFPGRQAYFFQMPSDDFFASDFLAKTELRPDFSFLDGMHHYEFLLRDMINAEAASAPGGAIALHDCCPFNAVMTERKWVRRRTREWTGDVWKVLAILLDKRPDLSIKVYDAAPTGLVVIENADPNNTALKDQYDAILAQYDGVEIKDYGVTNFFDSLEYADTSAYLTETQAL